MERSNIAEVAFDGTKFYWRTRNTVDVVIAHHQSLKTFEVIVYEPALDKEAPRIYLNKEILMTKVDHNEVDSKLSFAKRNNVPLTEKFVTGIMNKAVSDFVLNRLVIKELIVSEKKFVVELRIDDNEFMLYPDLADLICERPESLVPQQTKHFKHLMESAVVEAMQALEEDKRLLQQTCEVAAEMSARVSPIVRDRWRMPLVLNKVLRGACLCFNDAKIFEKIKSNLKSDEDVARMHTAMRTGEPAKGSHPSLRHSLVKEQSFKNKTMPLLREPSFRKLAQGGADVHAHSPLASEHSYRKGTHCVAEPHAPLQKELSITRRCGADADSPTSKDMGTLKKTASAARFDTISSRGKMAAEDIQPSTVSTKKSALKRKKSKAVPKAPRRSSMNAPSEDSGEIQSQLSDSDDSSSPTHFERVVAGFAALGASIRSSFQFSAAAASIGKIEEGCERAESNRALLLSDKVDFTDTGVVDCPHTTEATGGSCSAMDTELDAPAFDETNVKAKRGSALGSFLLALMTRRSGEVTPTPYPSTRGSFFGAALTSLISSKKVLPAQ